MIKNNLYKSGFTLVELSMAFAIVAIMSASMLGAYQRTIRIERFSANLQEIKDDFLQAKTQSLAIEVREDCPMQATNPEVCYWRGTVVEFSLSDNTLTRKFLFGRDITVYRNQGNHYEDIVTSAVTERIALADKNMEIKSIEYSGSAKGHVSVAQFTPYGQIRTSSSVFNPGTTTAPYTETADITMTFVDLATQVEGVMKIDSSNGTINITI